MGNQNLPKKKTVSDELVELIECKIRENNALLKLIGKIEMNRTDENKNIKGKTDRYHKENK